MERRRALALAATTALMTTSGAVAAGATGALPILGFGSDTPSATADAAPDGPVASAPDEPSWAPADDSTTTWPPAQWPTPDPIYVTEYQYIDDVIVVPSRRPSPDPTTTVPAEVTTTVPSGDGDGSTTTVPEPPVTTAPTTTPEPPSTTRPDDHDGDHDDDGHDDDDDDHGDDDDDSYGNGGGGGGTGTTSACRSLKVEDDGTVHCED